MRVRLNRRDILRFGRCLCWTHPCRRPSDIWAESFGTGLRVERASPTHLAWALSPFRGLTSAAAAAAAAAFRAMLASTSTTSTAIPATDAPAELLVSSTCSLALAAVDLVVAASRAAPQRAVTASRWARTVGTLAGMCGPGSTCRLVSGARQDPRTHIRTHTSTPKAAQRNGPRIRTGVRREQQLWAAALRLWRAPAWRRSVGTGTGIGTETENEAEARKSARWWATSWAAATRGRSRSWAATRAKPTTAAAPRRERTPRTLARPSSRPRLQLLRPRRSSASSTGRATPLPPMMQPPPPPPLAFTPRRPRTTRVRTNTCQRAAATRAASRCWWASATRPLPRRALPPPLTPARTPARIPSRLTSWTVRAARPTLQSRRRPNSSSSSSSSRAVVRLPTPTPLTRPHCSRRQPAPLPIPASPECLSLTRSKACLSLIRIMQWPWLRAQLLMQLRLTATPSQPQPQPLSALRVCIQQPTCPVPPAHSISWSCHSHSLSLSLSLRPSLLYNISPLAICSGNLLWHRTTRTPQQQQHFCSSTCKRPRFCKRLQAFLRRARLSHRFRRSLLWQWTSSARAAASSRRPRRLLCSPQSLWCTLKLLNSHSYRRRLLSPRRPALRSIAPCPCSSFSQQQQRPLAWCSTRRLERQGSACRRVRCRHFLSRSQRLHSPSSNSATNARRSTLATTTTTGRSSCEWAISAPASCFPSTAPRCTRCRSSTCAPSRRPLRPRRAPRAHPPPPRLYCAGRRRRPVRRLRVLLASVARAARHRSLWTARATRRARASACPRRRTRHPRTSSSRPSLQPNSTPTQVPNTGTHSSSDFILLYSFLRTWSQHLYWLRFPLFSKRGHCLRLFSYA